MRATWRTGVFGGIVLAAFAAGCPAARTEGSAGPTFAVPERTPAPAGPDARALYEGFTEDHPWRASVVRLGNWKVTAAEEWRTAGTGNEGVLPFDVVVAEVAGELVRVVTAHEDVLYAVWISAEDLAWVPVQPVALGAAPGTAGAADGPGVRLAGGAPIEVLERQNGWAHVRTAQPEVQAEGWVPEVLLARYYRDSDFDVLAETVDLEPTAGLEVREAPNGRVLAVLRADASAAVRVRALGEPQEGWREISFPTARLAVRGWVRAEGLSSVAAANPEASAHSVFAVRPRGDYRWLQVPIAMELSTLPADGEVFGVTVQGTKLMVQTARAPSRTAVAIRTLWGDAQGWVKCEPIPSGMDQPLMDTCIAPFDEEL